MAALDHNPRPRGFVHDWLPVLLLAAACAGVVALNLHV